MTQSISNFNRGNLILPNEPIPASPETSQKFNLSSFESYEGTSWTNVPGISNIVYAPYEAVLAIGALIRATATHDDEAWLDAGLRLAQQPFSFLGAIASGAVTVLEIGVYFKSFKFQSFMPAVNAAASGLGLVLCAIELFFESLGLYRATSFISSFYSTGSPKAPDFSQMQDPREIKEKLIKWARYTIDNPESMERALGADTTQAIVQQLNGFIADLEANGNSFSQTEFRTQTQNFLSQVKEKLVLADLKHLRREYFSITPLGLERIDALARHRFPDLNGAELEEKKGDIATQVANRKASDLARRVQPWFVRELDEKLDPLIDKLSNSDPQVRAQAHREATVLLDEMDTQAKKKILAHVIGIIGIVIVAAGLIAGMTACPFLVPIVLLTVGGAITIARYYFCKGYWNSRGWHFDISECIPAPIKWAYRKIKELGKVQDEARNSPRYEYPWTERQVFQLSNVSYFLPQTERREHRLSDVSHYLPARTALS
ncbi:MAG: hypothetical protein JSR39_05570 [Verrucomicrobia bacterium]|nr:hypothetical protein [Verrucomicrobiota bacterium]